MSDEKINTWEFDPKPLLLSSRKVTGTFHKSKVDKDGELITPDAIRNSIPDYMHLPALHDFHKERPVGLATKIWELKDGEFGFEGVIKATADCDDVWDKITKGSYDHLSIFGKREAHNSQCDIPQQMRTGPCITTGVRLDSISVCDMNARNDQTSLEVKKARMVFDAEKLIKAETAGSSNLMHQVTDYPEKKCGGCGSSKDEIKKKGQKYRVVEKCNDTEEKAIVRVPLTKRPERQKVRFTQMRPPQMGEKKVEKADEDSVDKAAPARPDEWLKEKGRQNPSTFKNRPHPQVNPAGHKGTTPSFPNKETDVPPPPKPKGVKCKNCAHRGRQDSKLHTGTGDESRHKESTCAAGAKPKHRDTTHYCGKHEPVKKSEEANDMSEKEYVEKSDEMPDDEQQEEQIEKGSMVTPSGDLEDQYDEEEDSSKKKVKRTDKEGQWSKKKDPNGTVKMSKAKDRMDYGDVEEDEDDSEGEADDESEDKDVEKGASDRQSYKNKEGHKIESMHELAKETGISEGTQKRRSAKVARMRAEEQADTDYNRWRGKHDAKAGAEGLKQIPMRKGTVKKGDNMEDEKPVEKGENVQEYVTKAMVPIEEVDTIIKARTEEITKAYTVQIDELKKAHADLKTQVEKMEKETIRKGGSIIVIPQLLDPDNKGMLSNADAVARMQAGRT